MQSDLEIQLVDSHQHNPCTSEMQSEPSRTDTPSASDKAWLYSQSFALIIATGIPTTRQQAHAGQHVKVLVVTAIVGEIQMVRHTRVLGSRSRVCESGLDTWRGST